MGWALGLLFALLVLGVGSASGRALATKTVTVDVIGLGTVTSDPGGLQCGNGETTCHLVFSSSSPVTLTGTPADGWSISTWTGCSSTPDDTCKLDDVDAVYHVTAIFTGSPTTTSTLSVTHSVSSPGAGGIVEGGGPSGSSEISCGTGPGEDTCTWTVPTGSTVTVQETPDDGSVFTGWGGACSGTHDICTVQLNSDAPLSAAWGGASDTALLTVAVVGSGSVQGGGINCPDTCTATEPKNSTVVLTASAQGDFTFTKWTGACDGSTSPTCAVTMDAAKTVTATFTGPAPPGPELTVVVNGNGNVAGANGAINCGAGGTVCSANTALNQQVTLTETASLGATFVGWSGACGGVGTSCIVLMNQAKSVTATFAPALPLTLTVSVTGNGTVTGGGISCGSNGGPTCSANETLNANVTLTATPGTGATFSSWGGACTGITPTCTVTMTAAKSVTATFSGGTTPPPPPPPSSTFQLSVSVSGNGTVAGGGISCGHGATRCTASESRNSSVTLTETPATGATFAGWGGACTGTAKTCAVTMSAAKSVTARFTGGTAPPTSTETLSIEVTGRGTISSTSGKCAATGPKKTCVQKFAKGKTVVLTAGALKDAKFLRWGGACTGTKTTCSLQLTAPKAVTATFSGAVAPTEPAVLTSLQRPSVKRTTTAYLVTLRFKSTLGGLVVVRGLRAGRVATTLSLKIAAGTATIGPFRVAKGGLYTFVVKLGTHTISWTACLGRCGKAAPPPNFVLAREAPTAVRTGDIWSVTLHLRANLISQARVRAYREGKLLVDRRFLANSGTISVGPFLLGPGKYTLRVDAVDGFGRARTVTWVAALAV
jgi:hypothetical protein